CCLSVAPPVFVSVWRIRTVPLVFFFFSSRRRHTRFSRDWSSDVCSSDLLVEAELSTRQHLRYVIYIYPYPSRALRQQLLAPISIHHNFAKRSVPHLKHVSKTQNKQQPLVHHCIMN